MFYIVYKTTNLVNKKIYIGIHRTENLNDNYLGSGVYLKQAIKKYGRENFIREILFICNSYEEATKIERNLVNEDFVKKKTNYNSEIGGSGGKYWDEELRTKMSRIQKKRYENGFKNWNAGIEMGCYLTEEGRKKLSEKSAGANNYFYGKNPWEMRSEEQKEILRQRLSERHKGNPKSPEQRAKMSVTARNKRYLVDKNNVCIRVNLDDPRLNDPNYQRGMKWKPIDNDDQGDDY